MSVIWQGYASIKTIPQDFIDEQRVGKWYSKSRVFIYKEGEKYAVVRAEWYERILAAFMKLFRRDYFAEKFEGKTCRRLSSEEVEAALKSPVIDPEKPSAESKAMLECWVKAVVTDPKQDITVWKDFFKSLSPLLKDKQFVYDTILKDWNPRESIVDDLYLTLAQHKLDEAGQTFLELLRIKFKEKGEVIVLIKNERKLFSLQALQTFIAYMQKQSPDYMKQINAAIKLSQEVDLGEGKAINLLNALKEGSIWFQDAANAKALMTELVNEYNAKQTKLFESYLADVLQNMPAEFIQNVILTAPYVNTPIHTLTRKLSDAGKVNLNPRPIPQKHDHSELLKQLNDIDQLIQKDFNTHSEEWQAFFQKCEHCLEQMGPGSFDAVLELANHIKGRLGSNENKLKFYDVARKADISLRAVRNVNNNIESEFAHQGYVICCVSKGKDQPSSSRLYPKAALEVLNKWYSTHLKHDVRGLNYWIIPQLKADDSRVCNYSNEYSEDFDEIVKPLHELSDIKNNSAKYNYGLGVLLKDLFGAYDIKPTEALKLFLKPIIEVNEWTEEFPDRNGPAFLLIGESQSSNIRYKWLTELYSALWLILAKSFAPGIEHAAPNVARPSATQIFKDFGGLDAALLAKVEPLLEQYLNNEKEFTDLCLGVTGRFALCCMWLQLKEETLLKSIPSMIKRFSDSEDGLVVSALPDILEEFAKDESRLAKYPNECDELLATLFKFRCNHFRGEGMSQWFSNSHWAILQNHPKLPLLKAAYQAEFKV